MPEYDTKSLKDEADKLYRKARYLVYLHASTALVLGFFLSMSIFSLTGPNAWTDAHIQMSGFVAILFAILGGIHGHVKAGELRLEAQRLLCLLASH